MFDYNFLYYNRELSKKERIGLLLYDKGSEIMFRAVTNRKHIDLAIKYYMLSANKYNNVFAMESMADEYVRGENINRDIRVAMNYHIKAVKLGYYPSMMKLAFCYLNLNKYAKAHKLENNKYFDISLTNYVHNSYLSRERLIDIVKEYKGTSFIACVNYIMMSKYEVDDTTKEKIEDFYLQYIYGVSKHNIFLDKFFEEIHEKWMRAGLELK